MAMRSQRPKARHACGGKRPPSVQPRRAAPQRSTHKPAGAREEAEAAWWVNLRNLDLPRTHEGEEQTRGRTQDPPSVCRAHASTPDDHITK